MFLGRALGGSSQALSSRSAGWGQTCPQDSHPKLLHSHLSRPSQTSSLDPRSSLQLCVAVQWRPTEGV